MGTLDATWRTKRPNTYRVEGDVAYIQLTKGQEAAVDVADLEIVLRFRWSANYDRRLGSYYAKAHARNTDGTVALVRMHSLVAGTVGCGRSTHTDHANHNTLDNRRSNLRAVSASENIFNREGAASHSQSRVRGVYPHHRKGKASRWTFDATCYGQRTIANFPYTDEGFEQAKAFSDNYYRGDIAA